MKRYAVRQLVQLAVVVVGISVLVFAILHVIGDPVLLLLPSREQIAERRRLPADKPAQSSIMLRDALVEFCAANALTCVDALDGLARPDVAFEGLFLPGDTHFSAAGHHVIADLLAPPLEHMLASLVPGSHQAGP